MKKWCKGANECFHAGIDPEQCDTCDWEPRTSEQLWEEIKNRRAYQHKQYQGRQAKKKKG
jgi:hypothetical protein